MADPKPLNLPTTEDMRARFHFVAAEVEKVEKVSGPLRAKRDALVNKHAEQVAKLDAEIKEAEEGLFDIKVEQGNLARLLRGQTGEAPE